LPFIFNSTGSGDLNSFRYIPIQLRFYPLQLNAECLHDKISIQGHYVFTQTMPLTDKLSKVFFFGMAKYLIH